MRSEKLRSEDRIITTIKNIYTINLGVKKHERVLVFTDRIRSDEEISDSDRERRERLIDIARLVVDVGKGLAKEIIYVEYPALKGHGSEPPERLWVAAFGRETVNEFKKNRIFTALLRKKATEKQLSIARDCVALWKDNAVDSVIALSNFSTSHTAFRDMLTRVAKTRYASMPLFDPSMFFGAMNVNWRALANRTTLLAEKIKKACKVLLVTPNGTRLSVIKENRHVGTDIGILTRPGSFGNLPAGEVFFAPMEGTADGKLILEWAPTHRLSYPICLLIKKGMVEDISGSPRTTALPPSCTQGRGEDSYAIYLRRRLSEDDNFRNIAEFGIGTNEGASRPDNILEAEKICGTVHIALGDNSSFGGKVRTPFHQDFVFFKPTVTIIYSDGNKEIILKDGRLGDRPRTII
ncbi:MAG: peptidase [Nitrospirota bacterium]